MEYTIAIPSYQRPETLKNKTLNLLQNHKIDPQRINIFVANKQQEQEYNDALEPNSYNKIIRGRKGIKNIRNFMSNHFDEGQKVFYMDDDITQMYQNYNNPQKNQRDKPCNLRKIDESYDRSNNYLLPLKNLHNLIMKGFQEAERRNLDNWGVYPVENPYFMKPTSQHKDDYMSNKLNYIMGGLTGVCNNRKAEIRTIDDKEDYERSIKYYLKDGGVLRINNVCARTNCYKEPGGMQVDRTKDRIHKSAEYLCHKYPQLCSLNTGKKSGYSEVRLRDIQKPIVKVIKSNEIKRNNNNSNNNNSNNNKNTKKKQLLQYLFKINKDREISSNNNVRNNNNNKRTKLKNLFTKYTNITSNNMTNNNNQSNNVVSNNVVSNNQSNNTNNNNVVSNNQSNNTNNNNVVSNNMSNNNVVSNNQSNNTNNNNSNNNNNVNINTRISKKVKKNNNNTSKRRRIRRNYLKGKNVNNKNNNNNGDIDIQVVPSSNQNNIGNIQPGNNDTMDNNGNNNKGGLVMKTLGEEVANETQHLIPASQLKNNNNKNNNYNNDNNNNNNNNNDDDKDDDSEVIPF